jgi:hypothetical protein
MSERARASCGRRVEKWEEDGSQNKELNVALSWYSLFLSRLFASLIIGKEFISRLSELFMLFFRPNSGRALARLLDLSPFVDRRIIPPRCRSSPELHRFLK